MHQTHFFELADAFDINGAPGASGPAWSEANRVAGFVETLSNAVDPAEAGERPSTDSGQVMLGFPESFL